MNPKHQPNRPESPPNAVSDGIVILILSAFTMALIVFMLDLGVDIGRSMFSAIVLGITLLRAYMKYLRNT